MTTPVRLTTGRTIPFNECTGSTPVFANMPDQFATPEDLARYVGEHYGWRSTTPTHSGLTMDGIGWWVIDAMTAIYADTITDRTGPDSRSYFELVDDLDEMSTGYHAHLVAIALEMAGLVTAPFERIP